MPIEPGRANIGGAVTTRVLVLFVDGVGVGEDDRERNPFSAAPPVHLTQLLRSGRATLAPLDATLGVDGLPQSGTGQYSLFTGDNGARRFGRHFGPWVPTALRADLRSDNLLTRARANGYRIAFANAYPEQLIEAAHRSGEFRPIGPLRTAVPLAAFGAGVLTRHIDALQAGEAVASEIVHDGWQQRVRPDLPSITPQAAGRNLGRIANSHDLTLFAHYQTDTAGHAQDLSVAVTALTLFDTFLGGILDALDSAATLLIVSDHGNLEDVTAGHTRNPALGVVAGPAHEQVAAQLSSLMDVPAAVETLLRGSAGPGNRTTS